MKAVSLAVLSIVLISSCSSPSVKKEDVKAPVDLSKIYFADSGYSAIIITHDTLNGGDMYLQSKETRSYNVVRLKRGPDYVNLLITETSRQAVSLEAEGQTGTIDLTGRISEGGNLNKEIWKKHVDGNNVNYDWDYFEVENYGCCAAVAGKKIYRYADAEELVDFTGDLYEVEIPNTEVSRYMGFKAINSANEFAQKTDSNLLGILTFIDPISRSSQQIAVFAKNDKIFSDLEMSYDGLSFSGLNAKDKFNDGSKILQLWSADKINDAGKISGFNIVVKFEGDKMINVEIPMIDGKLVCEGFRSELLKIEELK